MQKSLYGAPIKGVYLVESGNCPGGYGRTDVDSNLNGDLNEGAGRRTEDIYLCDSISSGSAIYDLTLTQSGCPSRYERVPHVNDLNGDLNQGAGGSTIYLCLSRDPSTSPPVVAELDDRARANAQPANHHHKSNHKTNHHHNNPAELIALQLDESNDVARANATLQGLQRPLKADDLTDRVLKTMIKQELGKSPKGMSRADMMEALGFGAPEAPGDGSAKPDNGIFGTPVTNEPVANEQSAQDKMMPAAMTFSMSEAASLRNPPPPPRAPETFDFAANCHRGVSVGGTSVHATSVPVDKSNIWPALQACWEAVWNSYPSPLDDRQADGIELGVGDLNGGQCMALFNMDGYQLGEKQQNDWVYCQAPRGVGQGGLTKAYAK
eukprot:scaffold119164_cov48-Phaeocystis_antarctica.AAC.1